MKNVKLIVAAAALVVGGAAFAGSQSGEVDLSTLPTQVTAMVEQLKAEGYQIEEVEVEEGEIEIEAVKDGIEREITFAADTGEVLEDETEKSDAEDDDDDDVNNG